MAARSQPLGMSMPFRITDWPYVMQSDPVQAAETILDAFRIADGDAGKAAASLDLSRRQLYVYITRLNLLAETQGIRRRAKEARRQDKDE